MSEKKRIAVLVSGGGTNLQALLDAQHRGENPQGEIVLVLSSSPTAYALERAAKAGVMGVVVARRDFENGQDFDNAIISQLVAHRIDLVVLAGFMSILGKDLTDAYDKRIINVHPSLIPSFCGEGFYGLRVHKAALDYGVKLTGATVHYVNEVPDGGEILLQKAVEIHPDDTPETLQKRVMTEAEWDILPKAVAMWCNEH